MTTDKKKVRSTKNILQWTSVGLILLSSLPCLFTFVNIQSAIIYAIEKGISVSLQLYVTLGLASIGTGVALLLLLISLFLKEKINLGEENE